MSEREEWGPWIEHDGSCRPVSGCTITETVDRFGESYVCRADDPMNEDPDTGSSWIWGGCFDSDEIVRYRFRKPRGMSILRERLAEIDAPQREGVPA